METSVLLLSFISICIVNGGYSTDTSMAGQCKPSEIYKEMTLKGGINAGTYKDVGGVGTMEECQSKCCSFPACDLAFMLAGSCYLVGCKDQKQCAMQPAKESTFKPMISYVTRWNNEGVKHTVTQEKENQYTCPKMNPISKVTLKGGLQAGDFTDIGRVGSLKDCYGTCCQQQKCDLAFMLGQNCFTVICKDKRLCVTTPAQPSIFNPQIAYVTKRGLVSAKKENIPRPDGSTSTNSACPNTRTFDNMTLKGGVDAGAYKDQGEIKDMATCRRICCEMTECHLAFMLGKSCFSVKCANVDACRAQRAKPSAYSPKISYVRKVGTNQLLPDSPVPSNTTIATTVQTTVTPPKPDALSKINDLSSALQKVSSTPSANSVVPAPKSQEPNIALVALDKASQLSTTLKTATPDGDATHKNTSTANAKTNQQDLLSALEQASLQPQASAVKTDNGTAKSLDTCKPGHVRLNVTLKGGRKAGDFVEQKGVKDMKECVHKCCTDTDKKCNLAFMLGNACYSVKCSQPELCRTIKAPPTKFNPVVQYVRGLDDTLGVDVTATNPSITTTITPQPEKPLPETTSTTTPPPSASACQSQPVVRGKSIRGGKKAGKFKIYRAIKDLDTCINKCCSLKHDCDVAYMEDSNCYSIQCFKKSACTAIPLRETDVSPMFAYMDHFLDKVDEEEAESDLTTELDQQPDTSACANVEIKNNKTLKGGTKAGKFHPIGKKNMVDCISNCCDRPNCDVAYLLNGHCYAVECTDSKLCQATGEPTKVGDNVQLAYMNKVGIEEKQRDYMAIYVIVASLVIACVAGGFIWAAFAFKKRQRLNDTHKRLLEPEDEEETIDNIMHKKPSSRSRYRKPKY